MPVQVKTLDGWTVAHAATGFILASLGIPRGPAYAIIIGTEILEVLLRRVPRVAGFFGETQQNIAADIVVSILGFEVTRAAL